MAKPLMVLFLTAFIYAASQALAVGRQKSIGQANEMLENYEENELRHQALNEVLADLEDTTADTEKHNPFILRRVENSLRNLAERVKEKRMLICSTKPKPYCDIDGW